MSACEISIVMPVFNEPVHFLKEAVRSICRQSFEDWELLIIDDGTTNKDTLDVLSDLKQCDSRIKVISKPNEGQTSALILGIKNAASGLIARHDADDVSLPSRLQKQWEVMQGNSKCALVGCNYQYITEKGEMLHTAYLPVEATEIRKAFSRYNPFGHGSVIFKKDVYDEIGGYRAFFRHCQDYDLFWRIAEKYEVKNIQDVEYLYRLRSGSQSHTKQESFYYEVEVARALATQRSTGKENLASAVAYAEARCATWKARRQVVILNGDQLMLTGSCLRAMRYFATGASMGSLIALLKVFRCASWILFPGMRRFMYRVRRA